MPRAKTTLSRSPAESELNRWASDFSEHRDCAVRAVAVVTGVSYAEAHAALTAAGRAPRRGTYTPTIRSALAALGFEAELQNLQRIIDSYPGAHAQLRNVTTHHPERFSKVWRDGRAYLLFTNEHVAGCVDGHVHDWTRGRACRVTMVWEVKRQK